MMLPQPGGNCNLNILIPRAPSNPTVIETRKKIQKFGRPSIHEVLSVIMGVISVQI